MATVNVYTAERMQAIEDSAIVGGAVVSGKLILTRHDTSQIDAGQVVGPQGIQGIKGDAGEVTDAELTAGLATKADASTVASLVDTIGKMNAVHNYSPTWTNGTAFGTLTYNTCHYRFQGGVAQNDYGFLLMEGMLQPASSSAAPDEPVMDLPSGFVLYPYPLATDLIPYGVVLVHEPGQSGPYDRVWGYSRRETGTSIKLVQQDYESAIGNSGFAGIELPLTSGNNTWTQDGDHVLSYCIQAYARRTLDAPALP